MGNRSRAAKPALLQWSDAWKLTSAERQETFATHLHPGLYAVLERLGYEAVDIVAARGPYYVESSGREILDFWGGFGTFNVGHNHPRLAAVRRAFDEQERPELLHAFVSAQAAVLAKNLSTLLPADLGTAYLCCTGSEAVEAALKMAERFKGNVAGRFLFAEGAMHGKTHGALSVTGNDRVKKPFKTLSNCVAFPFGDAYALESALRAGRGMGPSGEPIAVILEPIQSGNGIVVPPSGYLRAARRLCDRYGAVLIIDEVQTGFGRTGKLFAFEHDGIVPDIVVLSKAMGGGKTPIAACVARHRLFRQAFGTAGDATLHNATFNGMGGAAAISTEVLHILFDENLVANAAMVGDYLRRRLEDIADRHSDLVSDARGRGLLCGLELRNATELMPASAVGAYMPKLRALGDGAIAALVAARLLHEHGVLVAFTDFNRNVLRFEPPLAVTEDHVDRLAVGLDEALGLGLSGLVRQAFEGRLAKVVRSDYRDRGRGTARNV